MKHTVESVFFGGRRELLHEGVDAYAEAHTSTPPELVQRLERDTRGRFDSIMLSDRCVGRLLKILTTTLSPDLAVDVGTYTGHSALCIAEGLRDGARVVTCEIDPKQAELARGYFAQSPYQDRIDLRVGPALDTIRSLDKRIGLAFIDGEKNEYWDYCEAILERLAPRGLIVVDNTLMLGSVLLDDAQAKSLHPVFQGLRDAIAKFNKRVQDDRRVDNCLLTISDGVTLISRTA
jgi:caffeoyl-CoA O-methyltransferase